MSPLLITDEFIMDGKVSETDLEREKRNFLCSGIECYNYSLEQKKICKPLMKASSGLFITDSVTGRIENLFTIKI